MNFDRRQALKASSVVILAGCGRTSATPSNTEREQHAAASGNERSASSDEAQEVSPTEDLMQEHGLLERLLGLYAECARRLRTGEPFSLEVLRDTLSMTQSFVHDYHEQNEEQFLFARASSNAELAPLVRVLRDQHARGREYNAAMTELMRTGLTQASQRTAVATAADDLVRMYRPHAARENSVFFPASRALYSHHEWHDLGERFETEEHRRFGTEGFEGMVRRVADLERAVGIEELATMTAPTLHVP
jgi:hemerythrin-like domain-containing protein